MLRLLPMSVIRDCRRLDQHNSRGCLLGKGIWGLDLTLNFKRGKDVK